MAKLFTLGAILCVVSAGLSSCIPQMLRAAELRMEYPCRECNGTGHGEYGELRNYRDGQYVEWESCPVCKGTGIDPAYNNKDYIMFGN